VVITIPVCDRQADEVTVHKAQPSNLCSRLERGGLQPTHLLFKGERAGEAVRQSEVDTIAAYGILKPHSSLAILIVCKWLIPCTMGFFERG
jgi:hypothetical protein